MAYVPPQLVSLLRELVSSLTSDMQMATAGAGDLDGEGYDAAVVGSALQVRTRGSHSIGVTSVRGSWERASDRQICGMLCMLPECYRGLSVLRFIQRMRGAPASCRPTALQLRCGPTFCCNAVACAVCDISSALCLAQVCTRALRAQAAKWVCQVYGV